ncbi:FxSxx-COOH system tetratricopeptide repeat protein [Streptomyces netropsis]|uniref:Tetratricopeptide (TPR) repeat protein n=1 Tax=Streptomyces netropsis TaxID=55404 RepID=A0A7W7LAG5_STRNE|nr:FxSxx-COOH system tetratricopeptide repeat protein [Streptomyces netropsis]MBB4886628.1 tetratricopeptide (TPR) repeat protein [Streptomyces netropsis]GGR21490.1 cytochrome c [Streptomyces netropsis]
MTGTPRERSPVPGDAREGQPADADRTGVGEPDWREYADAVWLTAARLRHPPAAPSAHDPPLPTAHGTERDDDVPGRPDAPPDAAPKAPVPPPPLDHAPQAAPEPKPYGDEVPIPVRPTRPAERPDPIPPPVVRNQSLLAKALHRLGRRVPSRYRTELDEERTARHGIIDGLWMPYLRPTPERAFDLVVLADDGPTMPVWAREVERITVEAERSGAFRDVRTARLALAPARAGLRLPGHRTADPAELIDGRGTRVFLVVTDGLGAEWAGPGAQRLLHQLSTAGPTALVHLLPTYLWHRSSVRPRPSRLESGGFGTSNQAMGYGDPSVGGDPTRPMPPRGGPGGTFPVPVLSLKPAAFGLWAELVTGEPGLSRQLPVVFPDELPRAAAASGLRAPRTGTPAAAARAVRRFESLATPTARRLATHIAALPFEFELIEQLRHRMVPQASPAHLSEILMGGLIDWRAPDRGGPDFANGVREALLALGTRSQLARVVTNFAELRDGRERGGRLKAILRDPGSVALPEVSEAGQAWLRVELAVLRALSGPYSRRAGELARRAARELGSLGDAPGVSAGGSEGSSLGMNEANDPDTSGTPEIPGDVVQPTSPITEDRKADPQMERDTSEIRVIRTGRPAVMGNVPQKNPNFTGRESLLDSIEEQLRGDGTTAVLPQALHGMGGVGKSQLAIEYIYRHSHEYNVIWWIPAEQESLILGALSELARRLGLDVGPQANTTVPAVREALRSGKPYDNWLLVFDNAEDIDVARRYFPTDGPGKILITSRNREWERIVPPLSVDVFTRAESVALLQRRARGMSDQDADRLADALGDLPLAVEQAGAWIAATGMPVAEYVELLEQRTPGILQLDPSPDYPVSVAAAWNISLESLAESNPASRQLLDICACMSPEPIPISALRASRAIEITPELDPVLRNPVLIGRATRDLNRLSLIKLDHGTGTLQMHRLMQAVLLESMTAEEAARTRHAAHVLLAAAKPGAPHSSDQWVAYQRLLPHVIVSGAVRSDDPWVRELINDIVFYLYYWGAHETGASLAREAWNAWLGQSGEEDTQVLQMGKLLAYFLRLLGIGEEAHALNEQALEISRRPGVPEEELIDSMWQMAGALRYRGDFYAARDLDVEATGRALDLFGPEDPGALQAAHSYGVSLRLCGEFAKARELDEETVRQWELLYGPNSGLTLNTLNGLAIDIRESGDYPAARKLQEETYRVSTAVNGVDNAATVRAARNLAVCRRRDGSLAEAAELSEETLKRFTDRYGRDFRDTLATAMNVSVDRRLHGDLDSAQELGEDTARRYRATLGANHPFSLAAMVNLAATERARGRHARAEELDAEAGRRLRATLGDRHVTTLIGDLGVANNHYARLDFAAAHAVDSAALVVLEEVCGPDHPVTQCCRANLALDLRALGRNQEADDMHARAVGALSRCVRAGHYWLEAANAHRRIECDIAPMPM